jgi:DNA-binding transcriptional LysR family regulator
MLDETKIKCFLSLAETLNFTNTAKTLFMSQQAVSKNIAHLEKDLGFPLFVRSSRLVVLTKEGKECYALFSEFRKNLNAAIAEIKYSYNEICKILRVGHQHFLNFGSVTSKAFSKLQEKVPDLKLDGTRYPPGLLIERLLSRRVHLILINGRFAPKMAGLKSLELVNTPQVLMVSVDNPLVTEDATYDAFIREPFIIDAFENESSLDFAKRAQREISLWELSPEKIIWVPDRDSAYTYAEMGYGIVIGSEMSRIAHDRNLKKYSIGKMETLLAVWHETDENPLVEKYAKCLQAEFKHQSHADRIG